MSKITLGWVYVLTNPSFKDGMIKIGFTNKPTPQERAQELSKHTGVPTEFQVVYAVKIAQAQSVEGRVHEILQHKRARNNREFFECSIAEAVQAIKSVGGRNIVETMDYRKGQPEKNMNTKPTPSASQSNKKNPPKLQKKTTKGFIFSGMVMLILLFLAAMFIIGWWTEKQENQSTSAQTAPLSSQQNNVSEKKQIVPDNTNSKDFSTKNNVKLEIARQDMQLSWDKIPDGIQKDLQHEQETWLRDTKKNCQEKSDCLIRAYEKRTEYLRGFSIR